MADTLKVLGQSNPSAGVLTDLYTVPGSRFVTASTIVIANRSSTATSFRVAISPAGAAIDDKHFLYFDIVIPGLDTFAATLGMTLEATDVVRVQATAATLSFNLFGLETTTPGGGVSITVEEADGNPSVTSVDKIVVTNGKLIDDGGGQVTLDISGDVAAFNDLSDVTLTSLATDDFLRFNGSVWVNDTRQTAVDKITNVAAATNEQILTKDTGSGNAIFKDAPASGLTGGSSQQFTNLVKNGNFSLWVNGTSLAPDQWALINDGTVAQNAAAGNVQFNEFSAEITSSADAASTPDFLEQTIIATIGTADNTIFRGRTVTFGCWVKAGAADEANITINDGVGTTDSSNNVGTGYEFLTVTRTLDASATTLTIRIKVIANSQVVYFDGAMLVEGDTAIGYAKNHFEARRVKVGLFSRDTSLASGTQAITGVGFQPRSVKFLSVGDSVVGEASWGYDTIDDSFSIDDAHNAVANSTQLEITHSILIIESTVANQYKGAVSSFDSDGFTIQWTKESSPTGSLQTIYMAEA